MEGRSPIEAILDAAAEVFAAQGFAGAKVDRIAAKAGVNKAGLYYHVGDKARLYELVLLRLFSGVAARAEAAVAAEEEPRRALEALVRSLAGTFEENALLPKIMAREMAGGGKGLSDAVMREILDVFAVTSRVLQQGRRAGEFGRVNPGVAHLSIVGGLIFAGLSRPLRERAAGPAPGKIDDLGVSMEDMIQHLVQTFGRGG